MSYRLRPKIVLTLCVFETITLWSRFKPLTEELILNRF